MLDNNDDWEAALIQSDVTLSLGHIEVARGDLLQLQFALADDQVLRPKDQNYTAEIRVPLSHEALVAVEQHRSGDLALGIRATLIVAPVVKRKNTSLLGVPTARYLEVAYPTSGNSGVIPQSDWLRYLQYLRWDETMLFELPAGVVRTVHAPTQQRWEAAVEQYRLGNWDNSLTECRKAIESLAWTKTSPGAAKADMKQLREFFDDTEKGEHLNALMVSFGHLLHLGRHESRPKGVSITRDDALLAITITAAVLRYVSVR